MKLFAYIMLLAMSALIGLPCQDTGMDANQHHTTTAAGATDEGGNDCNAHDHCSPFCACACCSASYVYIPFLSAALIIFPGKAVYFPCYKEKLAAASFPVWDPPRHAA